MSEGELTLPKAEFPEDFGKSIFPTFNVNVPMPKGTAIPRSIPEALPASHETPAAVAASRKSGI